MDQNQAADYNVSQNVNVTRVGVHLQLQAST